MAKANKAVSLGISALIVIVLILIVGFGLFLNYSFNTRSEMVITVTSTEPLEIQIESGNSLTLTNQIVGYYTMTYSTNGGCTVGTALLSLRNSTTYLIANPNNNITTVTGATTITVGRIVTDYSVNSLTTFTTKVFVLNCG
ncbi:MAG: hypothetical protein ACYC7D_07875 [Nitrososphaerales archaeon]